MARLRRYDPDPAAATTVTLRPPRRERWPRGRQHAVDAATGESQVSKRVARFSRSAAASHRRLHSEHARRWPQGTARAARGARGACLCTVSRRAHVAVDVRSREPFSLPYGMRSQRSDAPDLRWIRSLHEPGPVNRFFTAAGAAELRWCLPPFVIARPCFAVKRRTPGRSGETRSLCCVAEPGSPCPAACRVLFGSLLGSAGRYRFSCRCCEDAMPDITSWLSCACTCLAGSLETSSRVTAATDAGTPASLHAVAWGLAP